MEKATYKDLPKYYKSIRITKSKSKDYQGHTGWLYYLSGKLGYFDKCELLEKYNNIKLYYSELESAPEIKRQVIFLSDEVVKYED